MNKSIETGGNKQKSRGDRQIDLARSYNEVFTGPEGERVLFDLMDKLHFMSPTYHTGANPHECDRHEGQREAILYILKMLRYKPNKLMKIYEEGHEELSNLLGDY